VHTNDRKTAEERAVTRTHTMSWLAAVLAATACGDGTGPGLPPRYALAAIDGQPLPAVVSAGTLPPTTPGGTEVVCEYRVTSARITFGDGGRYVATSNTLRVCVDGRPDEAIATSGKGTFRLAGDTLTMTGDPSPYGGQAVWQGTRSGAELHLRQLTTLAGGAYGSGYGDFIMDLHTYTYRAVH
jgi:hypothetical protein